MTTPYSDVFDLFTMQIEDYRLIALYQSSPEDFSTYLMGWLILAISDFDICNQNLQDRDDVGQEFTEDLTDENKHILSKLMVKYWLIKNVNDVLSMNITLKDRDFDHYAESQNLKEKQSYLQTVKEECSYLLAGYAYKYNDWASWRNGIFYT